MLSRARCRNWARFQPALATPTIGIFRPWRSTSARSAGKICLKAKSPVAPKKTSASDGCCWSMLTRYHFMHISACENVQLTRERSYLLGLVTLLGAGLMVYAEAGGFAWDDGF